MTGKSLNQYRGEYLSDGHDRGVTGTELRVFWKDLRRTRASGLRPNSWVVLARAAPSLPTTFLPTFASNGRIYAFSANLPLQPICLTNSRIGCCANLAH